MSRFFLLLVFTNYAYSQDIYSDISSVANFNALHDDGGVLAVSNYGTGQAFIDINKDGLLDIVVSNQQGPNQLFINQGNESFIEPIAFQNIGLGKSLCKGVSIADFDNDGWDDIYFSCMGADHLFKNINGNSLIDVTAAVGIDNPYNSQNSAWADINHDGWLDLYVINYDYGTQVNDGGKPGDLISDAFYLNNGDGTFVNIISNLVYLQTLKPSLAVTFFDYDNDGDQDLYVVVDKLRGNVLWRNDGPAVDGCGPNWCFTDVSVTTNTDTPVHGMGVATGDVDNDGDYDLYFSSFDEQKLLINQVAQGSNNFIDGSVGSALNIQAVGWGTLFFDYNNDAWIDAYVATQDTDIGNSDSLFLNNHDGSFTDVTATCGATNTLKSEGVAYGDINNDGKLDLVLANRNVNYQLFKNDSLDTNNWIKLKLVGDYDINKNAIGSKITVVTGDGVSQIRTVTSGSSRGAGNEMTLHFGLGTSSISSIKITWANGLIQNLNSVKNNQLITVNYSNFVGIYHDGFE